MGDVPHEFKKGTSAIETFVDSVLDAFAVGGAVDNVANVMLPVGVSWVQQDVLAHQLHIGMNGAARDL
jgi:hypothetical protein